MTDVEENEEEQPKRYRPTAAQITLAIFVFILCMASGAYLVLHRTDVADTAIFYVLFPAVLAFALALTPMRQSPYAMTFKGLTLVLLVIAPLMGEGIICVLMAAPLFYGVAMIATAAVVQTVKILKGKNDDGKMRAFLVVPLLFMSVEGVTPQTTLPSHNTVSAHKIIAATEQGIEQALALPMRFDNSELPTYLALGFPRPIDSAGAGLAICDQRVIQFAGAPKRPVAVHPHHWGTNPTVLVLEVSERSANHVGFRTIEDNTPISSWMRWKDIDVDWQAIDNEHVEITWTISYQRLLAPSWYFGPWQSYAVTKSAGFLIDSLQIPKRAE